MYASTHFCTSQTFLQAKVRPLLAKFKCQMSNQMSKIQMSKLKGLKRSDPFKTKTDIVFRSEGLTFATSQD